MTTASARLRFLRSRSATPENIASHVSVLYGMMLAGKNTALATVKLPDGTFDNRRAPMRTLMALAVHETQRWKSLLTPDQHEEKQA